jgi:hypothetical protein
MKSEWKGGRGVAAGKQSIIGRPQLVNPPKNGSDECRGNAENTIDLQSQLCSKS